MRERLCLILCEGQERGFIACVDLDQNGSIAKRTGAQGRSAFVSHKFSRRIDDVGWNRHCRLWSGLGLCHLRSRIFLIPTFDHFEPFLVLIFFRIRLYHRAGKFFRALAASLSLVVDVVTNATLAIEGYSGAAKPDW